jgi:amino acid transporter
MSIAAFWAWVMANEAALATILLIVSEFLGAFPKVKSNGLVSFVLIQLREQARKKGAVDPTP